MRIIFQILVFNILLALIFVLNCTTSIEGPKAQPGYMASVQLAGKSQMEIEYEIVGEGYGEAIGELGFFSTVDPDIQSAYEMAIKSQDGDLLLDARTQIVEDRTCFGLSGSNTFKVWGMVAKLKYNTVKPISITQPTYPISNFSVILQKSVRAGFGSSFFSQLMEKAAEQAAKAAAQKAMSQINM